MPDKLQFAYGHTTEYLYDAAGVKHSVKQTTVKDNLLVPMGSTVVVPADKVAITNQTDYCGNMVYENGRLMKIFTEEGFITMWNEPEYGYFMKDHQGNNQIVACNDDYQSNQYYPFGTTFGKPDDGTYNRYKYNGKELDRMHGLDLYDYGARMYDSAIGRWGTMDPLAEKYYSISPYAYCGNNPVNRIDPDGRDWYWDKDKTRQYNPNIHSQDDLSKGQTYIGVTDVVKDKNGSVIENYREDGSIMYANETSAYKRMWSQAHQHYNDKKEVGGFTMKNGTVLVLPDYKNDADEMKIKEYGYAIGKGSLSLDKITGLIHTHQDKTKDATPSFYTGDGYGDLGVSRKMGGLPIMTIGHDGYIYGIFNPRNSMPNKYLNIDFSQITRTLLLKGMPLTTFLNKYPTIK